MAAAAVLRRYLRVARQFARIGVVRKTQFRVEFASQVVMDCIWYVTKVATFEILFQYADDIAGWSVSDVRVFLGFIFVSDAFMMMWLGMRWRFGRDLKDGKLDPLRVRPGATAFLYFFQQFSPEAVLNMVVAMAYLLIGVAMSGHGGAWATWAVLPWAIALSCWGITALTVFFSTIEFHLLSSDLSAYVTHALDPAATNPLDVFSRRIRLFLLMVVPVGVLAHVPASMVLGRYDVVTGLLDTAWMLAFGVGVLLFWKRSFRRYESAMS